jgi:hypothetical protein
MKNKYIISAYLIPLAISLVIGYYSFLGFNFYSLGAIRQSLINCSFWISLLFIAVCVLRILKIVHSNFRIFILIEISALLLVGFVFTKILEPFNHYFSVTARKELIESKIEPALSYAPKMYDEYLIYANSRISSYEAALRSAVANRRVFQAEYDKFGFDSTDVNDQIDFKIHEIRSNLIPTNLNEIKLQNTQWYIETKEALSSWRPISVVGNLVLLNNKIGFDIQYLEELSKYRSDNETAVDFYYTVSIENINQEFQFFENYSLSSMSLLIFLFLLSLMIYIFSKRNHKSPFKWTAITTRFNSKDKSDMFLNK